MKHKYINKLQFRNNDDVEFRLSVSYPLTTKANETRAVAGFYSQNRCDKIYRRWVVLLFKVLLVEDDPMIVSQLTKLLDGEGYAVISADSQDDAIRLATDNSFDIALLDVTLKQGNGFAVCAAIRQMQPGMPVIFLTASDDEYSTVAGLDMGASDYIAKPFRARELMSRMRAALRKGSSLAVLSTGGITLDPTSATVTKDGKEVILSALEYKLLLYLMQNSGKLVSREALRDAIWDTAGEYVSDNSINVYICRLRDRIEDDPSNPAVIKTVRGLGYKIGE